MPFGRVALGVSFRLDRRQSDTARNSGVFKAESGPQLLAESSGI